MPALHRILVPFYLLYLCLPVAAQSVAVERSGGGDRLQCSTSTGETVVVRVSDASILEERVRTVPGSAALGVTWSEHAAPGERSEWSTVSLDGEAFSEPRRTTYEIKLRHGEFDPVLETDSVSAALAASPEGRLYVVQYWTQGLEAYRTSVAGLGAQVHLYLARHANVVEMAPATAERVRALPFVRWVGPFHPAYKLEAQLRAEPLAGDTATVRINLLTMRRGAGSKDAVAARVRALGGTIDAISEETYLMSATLTRAGVRALAFHDDVQWIDTWTPNEDDMNIAREMHGANHVETVGGYTGTGVRVEVLDNGTDTTHPDLANFILHGQNDANDHGTCTAGIVAGSGAGNFAARGALPDALLIVADYSYLGNRYTHTAQLQDPAGPYRAVLQSNSWGSSRTFNYTSISQDMDQILFDHSRITLAQSQSNAGDQDSRPQAWAKNILSVGGIRHENTLAKSDDSWSDGASIGPAQDGRIKPDLASFYDDLLTTDRPGNAGYVPGNYRSNFGGTSGATPVVAGHVGLLYQMWADEVFGNSAPGATVFEDRPFNTTMKALVINTATQWTFSGTNHDRTRVHQGWGHPDLATAWDLRDRMLIIDETDVLSELDSTVHTVTVDAGTPALKATLVYRDWPGTTASSQHRINDLDLRVTAPEGTVYWGNNGLLSNMWSTPGGSANELDTVENVFIQDPAVGTWLVEVIAAEVNQDTHVETGALDADYALVVSGVDNGPPPAPVADFSGSPLGGQTPLNVFFSDSSTGGPTTWDWSFGDGGVSSLQNPTHVYTTPGDYAVVLTVAGPGGVDTETKVDYISVTSPDIGTTYCSPAVPNSTGSPAVLSASGSTSVGANDVTLLAGQMPTDQFGYFVASPDQGFVALPGGSAGNFCLGSGPLLGRYADDVLNSSIIGAFVMTVDLTAVPIAAAPGTIAIQPGDTWNFQAWFRDGATSNFTDGVSILFQ